MRQLLAGPDDAWVVEHGDVRELPQPTRLECWVGEGGWLVELLLPRTDAGVLVHALVVLAAFALLYRPARRAGLL
jgi:hypothetical protein